MSSFNIVVPSFNRAQIAKKSFINELCEVTECQIVVPPAQVSEYKKTMNSKVEIVEIPDQFEGKLLVKRNWILKNLFKNDFLMMADDDVIDLMMISDLGTEMISSEEIVEICNVGYDLAKFYEVNYFGFAQEGMAMHLNQKRDFIANNWFSEEFCGYTSDQVQYDDRFIFRGDIDLFFRQLILNEGVIKMNGYVTKNLFKHGAGEGGLRGNIDGEAIKHDNNLLIGKYGQKAKNMLRNIAGKKSTYKDTK